MKTLIAICAVAALAAAQPAHAETNEPATEAAAPTKAAPAVVPLEIKDFIGAWKVKDGRQQTFFITLKDDGTASSKWEDPKLADRAELGQWSLRKGEAMVTWQNGWKEIISFDGTRYHKRAYGSTHKLDGKPSNTSDAEKVAGAGE